MLGYSSATNADSTPDSFLITGCRCCRKMRSRLDDILPLSHLPLGFDPCFLLIIEMVESGKAAVKVTLSCSMELRWKLLRGGGGLGEC